jgi:hypothetical protein
MAKKKTKVARHNDGICARDKSALYTRCAGDKTKHAFQAGRSGLLCDSARAGRQGRAPGQGDRAGRKGRAPGEPPGQGARKQSGECISRTLH